jgi:hypothetical protein
MQRAGLAAAKRKTPQDPSSKKKGKEEEQEPKRLLPVELPQKGQKASHEPIMAPDLLTDTALDHQFRICVANGGYIVHHMADEEIEIDGEPVSVLAAKTFVCTDLKTLMAFMQGAIKNLEGDGTELQVPAKKK